MRLVRPAYVKAIHLGIYLCMFLAGVAVIFTPPGVIEKAVGGALTYVFGSFLTVGAFSGAVSVLPGIWWIERVGIILLITGISMYLVVVFSLNGSVLGIAISSAFILTFIQRWFEIKEYQLEPR